MEDFFTHKAFPKYSADCLHFIYVFLSLSRFIFVNLSIKAECPMAGNKHALTRYRILDACFSSKMRKYYAEDLIKKMQRGLGRALWY